MNLKTSSIMYVRRAPEGLLRNSVPGKKSFLDTPHFFRYFFKETISRQFTLEKRLRTEKREPQFIPVKTSERQTSETSNQNL